MEGKGEFRWSEPEKASFSALKKALVAATRLAHPDYSKGFEVHPDACDYGIGAALMQQRRGFDMPISFVSRVLNKSERNYSISEKEYLAIVWSLKKFRPYIWGTKITIRTDHHALCWLMTKSELSGRLERWSLALQEFDLQIFYKRGSLHEDADALSRYPVQESDDVTDIVWPVGAIGLDTGAWTAGQQQVKAWRRILEAMQKAQTDRYDSFVAKDGILY